MPNLIVNQRIVRAGGNPPAGATPSWIANGSPVGTTTPSVPMPAGLNAGDFILLHVCAWGASPTITTPSGWTLIESSYHSFDSGNVRRNIFYKFAVGGDGNVSVTTSSSNATGIAQSWLGVNTSSPIEGTTKTDSLGTSATASYLTMTTTGPNRRVLQWFENVNAGLDVPKNGSPDTGWTELLDTTGPGNTFGVQLDGKEFAAAGTTTGGTHTFSGSFSGGGSSLIAFALCPT